MDKTAFLVMDVQGGVVSRLPLPETYLPLLSKTINASRPHVAKIIYSTVSFRPGHPEINLSGPSFAVAAKKGNAFVVGTPDALVDPSIAPKEDFDIFVEKKRVSAFSGSGLDVILRGLGVETLVLTGLSTGGVVLSTVCEAADRDFKIVVLKDLCRDPDEDLHETLMSKIFPKRGEVITAEEWLARLGA
ncbi:isochorismatase family protein [Xylariomycetidae sp. FL2044]|nr:isochorismatase family protein [Xylariomycetidae sp. FL2044]